MPYILQTGVCRKDDSSPAMRYRIVMTGLNNQTPVVEVEKSYDAMGVGRWEPLMITEGNGVTFSILLDLARLFRDCQGNLLMEMNKTPPR